MSEGMPARLLNTRSPLVGASPLAKAESQLAVMLDVPTPSRASPLPQVFVLCPGAVNTHKPMWERACSR